MLASAPRRTEPDGERDEIDRELPVGQPASRKWNEDAYTSFMNSSLPASAPSASLPLPVAVTLQVPASAIRVDASVAMPPTQWYNNSALVGVLALLGVLLGLIVNHFKMKAELRAASVEAHRERITAARKEVYNELIGDFVQASKLIGQLPTIDVKENPNYADPLLPLAASVNRTWLVSDVETARKVREVHAKVNELFMSGVAMLPPMQELKDTIKHCTETLTQANVKRDAFLAEMQRNAIFNNGNQEVHSKLTAMKAVDEKIAHNSHEARQTAAKQHDELVRKYMEVMVPQLGAIMKGVQDFMYCARLEMGIEGDSDLLRDQTTDLFARVQTSVKGVIDATKPKPPPEKA